MRLVGCLHLLSGLSRVLLCQAVNEITVRVDVRVFVSRIAREMHPTWDRTHKSTRTWPLLTTRRKPNTLSTLRHDRVDARDDSLVVEQLDQRGLELADRAVVGSDPQLQVCGALVGHTQVQLVRPGGHDLDGR